MVNTSDAFHEAIRNDEPQMPLFLFDNAVMSYRDIDISSGGIQFSESAISGEDFVPGCVSSANLSFSLMNDTGAWNEFEFGEFNALLGVRTNQQTYESDASCYIRLGSTVFEGFDKAPYLRINGSGVSGVTEPVKSLFVLEEKLWAFTDSGYISFRWLGSRLVRTAFNIYQDPIVQNSREWMLTGKSLVYGYKIPELTTGLRPENNVIVFEGNVAEAYEMIPLGVFTADRPVFSNTKTVQVEAFDRMTLFDEEVSGEIASYPITVANLIDAVATLKGVTVETWNLVNGDRVIGSAPDFKNRTYRDVLRWLAEVTGTFVKFNRHGNLEFRWLRTVGMNLDAHDYSECNIGYYEAAPVSKVVIRDLDSDDVESGSGENIVYLQSNPIAKVLIGGG